MEFTINPNATVKCYSTIYLRVSPGRNSSEKGVRAKRVLSTLQQSIEGANEAFCNIFHKGGEILGFYLILRFLLPQTIELEIFEAEKEMDLHVGVSYETANIVTLSVTEDIIEKLKSMIV